MIGNTLLALFVLLFVAGILLGTIVGPIWLWLAVGPVAVALIVWGLAALGERVLKGWRII